MATVQVPLQFEKKAGLNERFVQTVQTLSLDQKDFSVTIEEQIVPRVRYFFAGRKTQNATDLTYVVGLQLLYRSR